jgi:hypothetical protein
MKPTWKKVYHASGYPTDPKRELERLLERDEWMSKNFKSDQLRGFREFLRQSIYASFGLSPKLLKESLHANFIEEIE